MTIRIIPRCTIPACICGIVAAILLSSGSIGRAQVDGAPPSPDGAAETPNGEVQPKKPIPLREQTVYIPFEDLRDVFETEGRGVFLPYEQFQALWAAARKLEAQTPVVEPPVDSLISEITSTATVRNDVLLISAKLKIELLKKGWNEVPLRLADAAIRTATVDGEVARVVGDPGQGYRALLLNPTSSPQKIEMHLEYAKAIDKTPGRNAVTFAAPLAPMNRWEIHIPEPGVSVQVAPMIAATQVAAHDRAAGGNGGNGGNGDAQSAADETVVEALLGAAPHVQIAWTPKAEGASGLAALASVDTAVQVIVDPGVVRTQATLNFTVSRAELSSLKVRVPVEQKVVSVFDANVRRWDVTPQDDAQTITIDLFQPASAHQSIAIELERFYESLGTDMDAVADPADGADASQSQVDIPAIAAVDVGRQQGVVAIRVSDALRAEVAARSGLSQVAHTELPGGMPRQPWNFAYRYARAPYELSLSVDRVASEIEADVLTALQLQPNRMTADVLIEYTIKRAGVYEMQLGLPADFQLESVRGQGFSDGQAAVVDSYYQDENDPQQLSVNLSQRALGKVGLALRLARTLGGQLQTPTDDAVSLDIAPVTVTDDTVGQTEGRFLVYAPENLRVVTGATSSLREVPASDVVSATSNLQLVQSAGLIPVMAFQYAGTDASPQLTLSAQRRKPHVTVRQLLIAEAEPGTIKYRCQLFYDVRYSGVKNLLIDIPAAIADDVRVETPGIREQVVPTPDDGNAADTGDVVTWQLSRGQEFLGSVPITLVWETPTGELELATPKQVSIPQIVPRDVDRHWGQVVLKKAETIDVVPAGEPSGVRPIDPRHDLMQGPASAKQQTAAVGDAALAVEFHDDWSFDVAITQYELEEVKQTSIDQSVVRVVVTRSDQLAVQAIYRIKSGQQRLAVQLPQDVADDAIHLDSEPLRINGRPVSLEKGSDAKTFYIPLVDLAPNEPAVLELRYTMPGDQGNIPLPIFPDEPAVQHVHLCAYVPQEFAYLGFTGPWTDRVDWQEIDGRMHPHPQRSDTELIEAVTQGHDQARTAALSFPVDGTMLLYSALKPPPPPDGSLSISAMDGNWLHGWVIAAMLIVGIAVVSRGVSTKIITLGALVGLAILLGVFLPSLSRHITGNVMAIGVVLVVLLWLAVMLAKGEPMSTIGKWQQRRQAMAERRAELAQANQAAAKEDGESAESPPADQGDAEKGGDDNA